MKKILCACLIAAFLLVSIPSFAGNPTCRLIGGNVLCDALAY